jgi:hypothetical protein
MVLEAGSKRDIGKSKEKFLLNRCYIKIAPATQHIEDSSSPYNSLAQPTLRVKFT